jgi:micrococcal nuclease
MSKIETLFKIYVIQFLIFAISAYSAVTYAESWNGKVIGVTDGDTIVVLNGTDTVKIRISEIDCPENGQPFSKAAKRFTSDFCFGKNVLIVPETVDKYGRTVAHVRSPEGSDLSIEIVAAGLAWHYKNYSSSELLATLENNSRQNKQGLWQDNDPIAPWDWRRGIRNSSQLNKSIDSIANEFHGNLQSRVFHSFTCKYFNCKNCSVTFDSATAAIKQGFRPCKLCKPTIAKGKPPQVQPVVDETTKRKTLEPVQQVIFPTANLPVTTSSAVLASIRQETSQSEKVETKKKVYEKKSLRNRIDNFLNLYCSTYESKNLDNFSELFIPGAKENGNRFVALFPKYKKNFSYTKTINYKIILKDYSYDQNEEIVKINGEFFLQWLLSDERWRENSGIISMSLIEDGTSFLVKELVYRRE